MSDDPPGEPPSGSGEFRARMLGVAAAVIAMVIFGLAISWPAPGLSVAIGFAIYLLARRAE